MPVKANTFSPVSSSALCLPCGMCCDGALFPCAALQDDEQDFAISLGMSLLQPPEKNGFQLPCHLFQGGCCTIYEQPRPKVCGGFECKLLRRYKLGRINLEEGLKKVRRARELLARIAGLMPQESDKNITITEIRMQRSLLGAGREAERRQHLQFLMEAAKYQMFVRSNFFVTLQKNAPPLTDAPEMTV